MGQPVSILGEDITTWKKFNAIVRTRQCGLLQRLPDFPDTILVTGCQRSGTTMLAGIINDSEGIADYRFGESDELAAALILAGYVSHEPRGRYCFQTTYLNECYHEYLEYRSHYRMVWLIRDPRSVVYSMLYNWGSNSPDKLFRSCGVPALAGLDRYGYRLLGPNAVSPLRRACWAYAGKTAQLFELHPVLGPDRLMVVDYDELVRNKETVLPAIYRFLDLDYQAHYGQRIETKGLAKKDRLSPRQIDVIRTICEPTYHRAKQLITPIEAAV
jgi:hypothetical protein